MLSRKSVVIINDNMELLVFGKEQVASQRGLSLKGYAKDGMEGLNLVIRKKPEVILVNFLMPRMNGLDMVTQLLNMEKDYNPEIYLTTSCTPEFMEDVLEKTYPHLIGKVTLSCIPDTLLNLINRIG